MTIRGIDVSKWQGFVNWKLAVNNGARFAYIKSSQWDTDPRFKENWANSKGILPRGAYHYLDWGWDEVKQAELMVKSMGADFGELPPACDFEQNPAPYGLTPTQTTAKLQRFLDTVECLTGRIPTIYTGYYFWKDWGNTLAKWTKYPQWLPWYASKAWIFYCTKGGTGAPKPWKQWTVWQYSDRGSGLAYGCQSASVDLNEFYGSEADFAMFTGGNSMPIPPPPIENLYVANANPRVRSSPDGTSLTNVIGMLTKGFQVVVDKNLNGWAHFVPQAAFPNGGWVWAVYLTKV